jgi:hypothetical protein
MNKERMKVNKIIHADAKIFGAYFISSNVI